MQNLIFQARTVVSILLLLTLSACGFQLRGNASLPEQLQPLYVAVKNSQLEMELRIILNASSIGLSDSVDSARAQLIVSDHNSKKISAALGEGARVIEYQLIESLSFELRDKAGQTVLGPRKLAQRKIMQNDSNKIVSSGEEEKLLRREMQQNLAAKIVRQLASFNYRSELGTTGNGKE